MVCFRIIDTITYMFLLPTYLVYQNLLCGVYLNMSSIDLTTPFKIGMYLLNREKRYQRFSEVNRYNTNFKLKPTKDIFRYHKIDCYALHTSTTRKNRFSNIFFLSVSYTTRPQWSPLKCMFYFIDTSMCMVYFKLRPKGHLRV